MNHSLDNSVIISKISSDSRIEVETRQVYKRMTELLPNTLSRIESQIRRGEKPGRSKRLALTSDPYLEAIDDISLLREKALKLKISIETHRMLIQARQSMNSFRKTAYEKGFSL